MMLKPMRAKDGQKTIADDPDLLVAFSPRNGDLLPEEVGYRAKRLVWWRCSLVPTHEWQAAPAAMKGCPFRSDSRADNVHPESAGHASSRPAQPPAHRRRERAPCAAHRPGSSGGRLLRWRPLLSQPADGRGLPAPQVA